LKEKLLSILKIVIPLGIGIYVVWYQFNQLTSEELNQIKDSFAKADYFWVLLSVACGVLSHISRAYRWKFLLEPLGYKTSFMNNLFGVMIGYVANIVIHRSGEVWRCIMVSRYEKVSFEKLFGTVVAERVADLIVLLTIGAAVFVIEISRLKDMFSELQIGFLETNSITSLALKGGLLMLITVVGSFVGWRILTRSQKTLMIKVRGLLHGLIEGVLSILKMKNKWAFLAHTAFIWTMYLAMFYAPFFALTETSDASVAAVLASFVMASLSIILVQGGIGVYPWAVAQTLTQYGIGYESGFAMGWIIWVAQTIMIVTFGVASLVLMPIINRRTETLE
jgi:uncharacterized protein (TIRG00374 family)